jgi:hypothetical protein
MFSTSISIKQSFIHKSRVIQLVKQRKLAFFPIWSTKYKSYMHSGSVWLKMTAAGIQDTLFFESEEEQKRTLNLESQPKTNKND